MSFWGSLFAKSGSAGRSISITELAAERARFLLDVIPLRQNMCPDGLGEVIQRLLDDVADIEKSDSPSRAVRMALCDRTLWLSNYQVIVMEPEPAPDPTGLRAMGGVTGQIKARVFDLFKADPEIEKESMRFPATTYEEAWNVSLLKYWQAKVHMETLNTVRKHIVGEATASSETDWHRPFLHASCIVAEQRYRTALGLPSALPVEKPDQEILRYNAFLEFVLSDEENPYLSWVAHFRNYPNAIDAMRAVYERFGQSQPEAQ
jgi:hypothetical protein